MRTLLLFVAYLFLANGFAHAQSLQGLSKIQLVIEDPDKDKGATACGITNKLIKDAFMYPVSASALQVTNDPAAPIFYIQPATLKLPVGCFTSINFQLYENQYVKPTFAEGPSRPAEVVYWEDTFVVAASEENRHSKRNRPHRRLH